jgi:hypothetical protein
MCSQDKSYLERLGVHPDARSFFSPYITNTREGIIIKFGNVAEHVQDNFHRIPVTEETWTAGNLNNASHVMVSSSAMDAIAWLHFHLHAWNLQNLFFVALGAVPSKTQIENFIYPHKQYRLIFSNDDLGATCDLKAASFIRQMPLTILADKQHFNITFRSKNYKLTNLSLAALEKAARFHFNIPVSKPKHFNTFYQQLKNGHSD